MDSFDSISEILCLDAVPHGVCILDQDFNIIFWNHTLEVWTNHSKEEFFNTSIFDHYPHLKEAKYYNRLKSVMEGAPPTIFSAQMHPFFIDSRFSDGSKRILQTTVSSSRTSDPEIGRLILSFIDMTVQYQQISEITHLRERALEEIEERKQVEEALRRSERKFRNLAENIPGAVYDYYYHASGKRSQQYLGPGLEDIIGKPEIPNIVNDMDRLISLIHPDDRSHFIEEGRKAEETGATLDCEYRLRTDDGVEKWVRSLGKAKKLEDDLYHWQGVLIDVTKQKEVEEERFRLVHKLLEAQKKESLSVLAGGIAHDFNNKLVTILGNANLLMQDSKLSPYLGEMVQSIEDAAYKLADLSRQMLNYSGKGHFIIDQIDIAELLEDMNHLILSTLTKKTKYDCKIGKDLPLCEGDSKQLKQMIINLVLNASEAIGGDTGTITVEAGKTFQTKSDLSYYQNGSNLDEGDYLFISVSDTGGGIDESIREKIFDPFFSTKFTGRGLGLAATLGIVEGHNGAIDVISEEGEGSTFTIYLPAIENTKSQSQEIEKTTDKVETKQSPREVQGNGKILVVDDEADVITLINAILVNAGYEVISAVDGLDGLEKFTDHMDDLLLVVMDLNMPRMDGAESYTEMQKLKDDVPVMVISGYKKSVAMKSFEGKEIAGFLAKPFSVNEFMEQIQNILS